MNMLFVVPICIPIKMFDVAVMRNMYALGILPIWDFVEICALMLFADM